jgi:hypothetical protein
MPSEDERQLDLKDIMRSAHGRRFIWSLLQDAKVFDNTFSSDPYTHAFNAGFREFGVRINREIMALFPAFYDIMFQEARVTDAEDAAQPE